jgi:lycopene cyclase domain-containing protein
VNAHYTYLLILAASVAGPLALSFDKKVAFFKSWKFLVPAMLFPAMLYIAWDVYFTAKGVWNFNDAYITGIRILNLPLEEVLFFFVVPYCCVFIYACVRSYFPAVKNKTGADIFLRLLAAVLLISGVFLFRRYYTSWTFVLTGSFIFFVYLARNFFTGFDAAAFLLSYAICLLPFLVVNGFLTALPVVRYNDFENLGIRLYTIPVEDAFYGMLLVLMNVVFFEKIKTGKLQNQD